MHRLSPVVLALLLPLIATSANAQGSNAAGYTMSSGNTLDFISGSGVQTDLLLSNEDQVTMTLPWTFPYYGVDYNTVTVSSNGGLTFVGPSVDPANDCLPAASTTNPPAIAALWDNLDPSQIFFPGFGGVFAWHDTTSFTGADRYIISWENTSFSAVLSPVPIGLGVYFQAQLYPNGDIELHYMILSTTGFSPNDAAGTATIGIRDVAGSSTPDPIEFSCDTQQMTLEGTSLLFEYCQDGDGDGACTTTDCDDSDPAIYPGALEICDDGFDQNCDGNDMAADTDADGYDSDLCVGGDDCDDSDPAIHPGIDTDADGYNVCEDCNDSLAIINPGMPEICGDSLDNDCSGADEPSDSDGDGYINVACTSVGGDDCDDTDANVNPGIDGDGDGYHSCEDCDDGAALVNDSATEICDGVDNDCDGVTDDVDEDADGEFPVACGGTDCDDLNPLASPSYDGDGDGSDSCVDCDDDDDTIHPGATELCDGIDQDCDGALDGQDADIGGTTAISSNFESDDGGLTGTGSWAWGEPTSGPMAAYDGDKVWATNLSGTYPNNETAYLSFTVDIPTGAPFLTFAHWTDDEGLPYDSTDVQLDDGTGWVTLNTQPLNSPLAWTVETYDLSTWAGTTGVEIRFAHITDSSVTYDGAYIDALSVESVDDADGDGWVDNCPNFGDCDSTDPNIYPGAPETCNDGIDQDCDGIDQTGDEDGDSYVDANCGGDDCDDNDAAVNPGVDADGDGSNVCEDCDDNDGALFPGNVETCSDGIDNNCDPSDDGETDEDGDGWTPCDGDCDDTDSYFNPDLDYDADGSHYCEDCNDNSPLQFPGNTEVCADAIDNDCDGGIDDIDEDGDGYLSAACGGDDCHDTDATINPSYDGDGDGNNVCEDCNDSDAAIYDGATEICDDEIDQDCDGEDLAGDADEDGHDSTACGGDDCDDGDAAFHPGATEICDGIDLDCDGSAEATDADTDGHFDADCGGDDCDDEAQAVHPSATEICNGIDDDCDGALLDGGEDDADEDGVPVCDDDCDDTNPDIHPGAEEICDGIDNDCDGSPDDGVITDGDGDGHERLACGGDDCDDSDNDVHPDQTEDCTDGVDNDCDELADGDDEDCDFATGGCACSGSGSSPVPAAQFAWLLVAVAGGALRRRRGVRV